ncbi:hypothetical protein BDV23DRAFT_18190 [Aspergillus alliaceus]|uniref:Uncharacterized protein n=1 Tax=Petromyces alliaceus TaxID=209559 RepID=A0A5N7CJ45_PETAA|nr:hypothetical protein BDV23DRAFT_18190 [Aspergillus alliaceus]
METLVFLFFFPLSAPTSIIDTHALARIGSFVFLDRLFRVILLLFQHISSSCLQSAWPGSVNRLGGIARLYLYLVLNK